VVRIGRVSACPYDFKGVYSWGVMNHPNGVGRTAPAAAANTMSFRVF